MTRLRSIAGIAGLSFGTALVVLDGGIANVALPTIARDLGTDGSAAVLIVTVYQLVLVMALLPLSAVGDRIGMRRLYLGGLVVFAAASLLAFFANSLPFLLVVRMLQALGAGATLSVTSAMLRSLYTARRLGRGLGFNSIVVSSAAALAPTAGGIILGFARWPWLFATAAPLALLALGLGRFLPDPPPNAEPFDFTGALLSATTFGLVIGGLESGVHRGSPVVSMAIAAIGIGFAVVLVRNQRRHPRPVFPVDLLARPVVGLSALGGFTVFVASMTLLVSLPFRLEHSFGFTPQQVGAMIAPWPLTTLVVAPLAGTLSDRYPAGLLGGIGMAMAIAGLVVVRRRVRLLHVAQRPVDRRFVAARAGGIGGRPRVDDAIVRPDDRGDARCHAARLRAWRRAGAGVRRGGAGGDCRPVQHCPAQPCDPPARRPRDRHRPARTDTELTS
jgi:DHA2 family multidrug resistance protein-like MFS transporter